MKMEKSKKKPFLNNKENKLKNRKIKKLIEIMKKYDLKVQMQIDKDGYKLSIDKKNLTDQEKIEATEGIQELYKIYDKIMDLSKKFFTTN